MVESVKASSPAAREVLRGRLGHGRLELDLVLVQVRRRAGVQPAPVALDRVAHRLGVRGEQEGVEVPVGGIEARRGPRRRVFLAPQPASASAAPPASSCLRVTSIGRP